MGTPAAIAAIFMKQRTASCSCGKLRVRVTGDPLGVGVCHCLACQRRTGSAFAELARFSAPFEVSGAASEYLYVGDHGSRFRFRFCPECGSTVTKTEEGDERSVSVPVGAFADPDFPPPTVSVYTSRKHAWVQLPPGIRAFDTDPG